MPSVRIPAGSAQLGGGRASRGVCVMDEFSLTVVPGGCRCGITSRVDVLLMIDADIHGGGSGGAWSSVLRAVTCGGSGRKMRRNSNQTFLYFLLLQFKSKCALVGGPKSTCTFNPASTRSQADHLHWSQHCVSSIRESLGTLGPHQEPFHTLRAKLIYSRRNCSREIAVFFPHSAFMQHKFIKDEVWSEELRGAHNKQAEHGAYWQVTWYTINQAIQSLHNQRSRL